MRVGRGLGKEIHARRSLAGRLKYQLNRGFPNSLRLFFSWEGIGTSTDSHDPTTRALRPKYGYLGSRALTCLRTRPG